MWAAIKRWWSGEVDVDQLTEFERQVCSLFELQIDRVMVGPNTIEIPGIPRFRILAGSARMETETCRTDYRKLTRHGQRMLCQMHERALQRAVVERRKEKTPSTGDAYKNSLTQQAMSHQLRSHGLDAQDYLVQGYLAQDYLAQENIAKMFSTLKTQAALIDPKLPGT